MSHYRITILQKLTLLSVVSSTVRNFPNIEDFSSYKRLDLYHKKPDKPETTCGGFMCKSSGLSDVRIRQILQAENRARNDYASHENISNLYVAEWNPLFAEMAREKVQLCLHPTSKDEIIYDSRILKEWYPNIETSLSHIPVALEAVIGQKVTSIHSSNALNDYQKILDNVANYFSNDEFNHPLALRRRGATIQIGCDHLIRDNKTHLLSHIVCFYGLLYFSNGLNNDYKPTIGVHCSKCDFYHYFPYLKYIPSKMEWACYPDLPYLCADLDPVNRIQRYDDFPYDCNSPKSEISERTSYTPFISNNGSITTTSPKKINNLPCYHYALPIIIITLFVIAFILYQIFIIRLKIHRI